ncbi:MAG: DUF502 domain-containing protein [Polyangiaceae bacterium]|nr:DUF502 domain-containing protein [Polyangiaceae bacterium]
MKRFLEYLVRGALTLAPFGVTLWVLVFAFRTVDSLVPIGIPGLGFVVTVALVTLAGFLSSSVLGGTLLKLLEKQLVRVPLLKLVYHSIKDLIEAFVGDHKRFERPVAVPLFTGSDIQLLGFVTRDALDVAGLEGVVAVYLPQSYNFAGNVVLVPRGRVRPLDVASGDLMTFIVSGGVSGFGIAAPGEPPSIPPLSIPTRRARPPVDPERTVEQTLETRLDPRDPGAR